MTVKNLKEILDKMPEDMRVVISVETPSGYVCPDGAVIDVKYAGRGIDWHGHEFILHPEYRLRVCNVEKWKNREPDI